LPSRPTTREDPPPQSCHSLSRLRPISELDLKDRNWPSQAKAVLELGALKLSSGRAPK